MAPTGPHLSLDFSLCQLGHQVTIWRGNLGLRKLQVPILAPRSSGVEDDLRDLAVLHARPVVVPRGVAELEGDLAAVMAVHRHLGRGVEEWG